MESQGHQIVVVGVVVVGVAVVVDVAEVVAVTGVCRSEPPVVDLATQHTFAAQNP